MEQSMYNRNRLAVADFIAITSKTVFVKTAPKTEVSPNFGKIVNSLVFGVTNNVATTSKMVFVKAATT